jgi:hypothetical protein
VTDEMDNNWSADHIRVSLFSNVVWSTPAEDIFFNVFGSSPETITNKPAANEISAVGNWDGLRLEVKRAFNRIDFVIQAVPSETEPMPLIKDVKLVLPKFSSRIAIWGSTQPRGVVRIALGCNALLLSQNIEDSYVKLKGLIKVIDIDVGRFREFRFQVNLPKTSSVSPDITINRLSNWASIAIRAAVLGIDAPKFLDDKIYVSCSLDVNTDGERTQPITGDLVEKLTEELSLICIDALDVGIS